MSARRGPDSELLRTFLSVADRGNTTLAAAADHRTQSSVSLRVKRLEEQLGVDLFQRTARGMRLTPAGKDLVPRAKQIIDQIDDIADVFGERLAGSIRIGVPDDYGQFVLEHALAHFFGRHPDVRVSVTSGCSGPFPDLVERGELDLAIYSAPPDDAADAFFQEPVVWAAHREFDVAANEVLPLALFDRTCWWRDVPTNVLRDARRSSRVLFSSPSHEGVRAAIVARLAVGILPRSALPPDVVEVPDLPPLPPSSLVLRTGAGAEPRGETSAPILQAMCDAIVDAFRRLAI